MRKSLDQQLAEFLRRRKGDQTFRAFSRQTGLGQGTLFRLVQGRQSLTLGRLNEVLQRLKCRLGDVFPDEFKR